MTQTLEQKITAARKIMPKLHVEKHEFYGYADVFFNQYLIDLASLQTPRYAVVATLHRKNINMPTTVGVRDEERMILSITYQETGTKERKSIRDEQPAGGYCTDRFDLYHQEHRLPGTVGTGYRDLSLEALTDEIVRVRWSLPERPDIARVYDIDLARAETLLPCLNLEESKAPRRTPGRRKTER